MHHVKEYITIDKNIHSGTPVFKDSRVPVQSLFDHLQDGVSLDEFLEDFPAVSKEQAQVVIEIAGKLLTAVNLDQLYEAAIGQQYP